jgi:hypothetical protein
MAAVRFYLATCAEQGRESGCCQQPDAAHLSLNVGDDYLTVTIWNHTGNAAATVDLTHKGNNIIHIDQFEGWPVGLYFLAVVTIHVSN